MRSFKYYILSFVLLFDFYASTFISSKFLNLFFVLFVLMFSTNKTKREAPVLVILLSLLTVFSLINFKLDLNNFFSEYVKLLTVVLLYFTLEDSNNFVRNLFKTIFQISYISLILIFFKNIIIPGSLTNIIEFGNLYLRFNISLPIILLPFIISKFTLLNIKKYKFYIFLLLLIFTTAISGWRAMQLGVALILAFYYFLNFKYFKIKIIFSIAILAFVLFGNINEIEIVKSITNPESEKDISSGRIYLWSKSIGVFQHSDNVKQLFGYGFGQYPQAINSINLGSLSFTLFNSEFESLNEKGEDSRIHAHNPFFNLLLENGIFGVIIYCFIIYVILRRIKNNRKIQIKDYYISLFILMVSGMFTSISYLNSPLIWLLLYLSKNSFDYDYRDFGDSRGREINSNKRISSKE